MEMNEIPPLGPTDESPAADPVDKPETVNLVEILQDKRGQAWLKKEAKRAIRELKADLESRKDYMATCAKHIELFAQKQETMSGPAEGAVKPALPFLAKVALRIWARVKSMVLQNEPTVVPTGPEDRDRSLRVTQHMTWQRRAKNPEWAPGMSASIMLWTVGGSLFRWSGWDPLRNRIFYDYMTPSDFVLPYTFRDPTPSMENVPRITRILRKPRHEIEALGDAGFYFGVDKLFPPYADDESEDGDEDKAGTTGAGATGEDEEYAKPIGKSDDEDDDPVKEAVDLIQGVEEPASPDVEGHFELLERYAWARLPGEKRQKPVCLTIEKSTLRVLRLVVREEDDPLDRRRYEQEQAANWVKHKNLMAQYEAAMQASMTPDPTTGQPSSAPLPSAPVLEEPEPVRKRVINPFVHYVFFRNPYGIYGFGVGLIAAGPNEIANCLMGEDIVARRFANIQMGFISNEATLDKGDQQARYGHFKELKVPIDQMQNAIVPFRFAPPSGNIMEVVEKLEHEIEEAMSAGNLLSGEPGRSHETATEFKGRMGQAMSAMSAAAEEFMSSLTVEYKNQARLNATYLSETEYFYVTEPDPENPRKKTTIQKQVTRAEYAEDYDITFSSDARLATDLELAENALAGYKLIREDPDAAKDPNLRLKSLKMALQALKLKELSDELPDEVPPPEPPKPMAQEEENAGFLNEEYHDVQADDDDLDHLFKQDEFETTPMFKDLTPTGKQMFEKHKRAHVARAYLKMMAMKGVPNVPGAENGAGGGGVPGMGEGDLAGGVPGVEGGPPDGGFPS